MNAPFVSGPTVPERRCGRDRGFLAFFTLFGGCLIFAGGGVLYRDLREMASTLEAQPRAKSDSRRFAIDHLTPEDGLEEATILSSFIFRSVMGATFEGISVHYPGFVSCSGPLQEA